MVLLLLAVATDGFAQSFGVPALEVSHLDDDPVAIRVVSGDMDAGFVPADATRGATINQRETAARWWRVTALEAIPAADSPSLVLHFPYLSGIGAWRPGDIMPLRRSLMGRDADLSHSARAFFIPLPDGLEQGQHVYIRLQSPTPVSMGVSIESDAESHRRDLVYAAWRAAVLATMLVLALLALGFWVGMGERAYGYLMVTLLGQALYLATTSGDLRIFPVLGEVLNGDPRIGRVAAFCALAASNSFLGYFLELRTSRPSLARMLQGLSVLALVLAALSMVSAARHIATVGNLMILASTLLVMVASVAGSLRGQRAARYVLLSWMPVMAMATMRSMELLALWSGPDWLAYAYPAGFAIAGLIITIGLSDKLLELRRDRDQASHMASYDTLTGLSSRQVIEDLLRTTIHEAHRSGMPLSVVFFDIDNFKRTNDNHGHRVGDECIRIVAMRARNRLRTYDQMGRYGGDEMVVILPDTALKEAVGVAENMRSAVNCRPVVVDDVALEITLSLGVAQLQPGESPEELLERADAALYACKSGGRDRVVGRVEPVPVEEDVVEEV